MYGIVWECMGDPDCGWIDELLVVPFKCKERFDQFGRRVTKDVIIYYINIIVAFIIAIILLLSLLCILLFYYCSLLLLPFATLLFNNFASEWNFFFEVWNVWRSFPSRPSFDHPSSLHPLTYLIISRFHSFAFILSIRLNFRWHNVLVWA